MDNARITKEILDFCKETDTYSYYNMKEYAAKNKPEWITFLSKRCNSIMIAELLKSYMRKNNKKYKDSAADAYESFINATVENENKT